MLDTETPRVLTPNVSDSGSDSESSSSYSDGDSSNSHSMAPTRPQSARLGTPVDRARRLMKECGLESEEDEGEEAVHEDARARSRTRSPNRSINQSTTCIYGIGGATLGTVKGELFPPILIVLLMKLLPKMQSVQITTIPHDADALRTVLLRVSLANTPILSPEHQQTLQQIQDLLRMEQADSFFTLPPPTDVESLLDVIFEDKTHVAELFEHADKNATRSSQRDTVESDQATVSDGTAEMLAEAPAVLQIDFSEADEQYGFHVVKDAVLAATYLLHCVTDSSGTIADESKMQKIIEYVFMLRGEEGYCSEDEESSEAQAPVADGESRKKRKKPKLTREVVAARKRRFKETLKVFQASLRTSKSNHEKNYVAVPRPSAATLHLRTDSGDDAHVRPVLSAWCCDGLAYCLNAPGLKRPALPVEWAEYATKDFVLDSVRISNAFVSRTRASGKAPEVQLLAALFERAMTRTRTGFTTKKDRKDFQDHKTYAVIPLRAPMSETVEAIRKRLEFVNELVVKDTAALLGLPPPLRRSSTTLTRAGPEVTSNPIVRYQQAVREQNEEKEVMELARGGKEGAGKVVTGKYKYSFTKLLADIELLQRACTAVLSIADDKISLWQPQAIGSEERSMAPFQTQHNALLHAVYRDIDYYSALRLSITAAVAHDMIDLGQSNVAGGRMLLFEQLASGVNQHTREMSFGSRRQRDARPIIVQLSVCGGGSVDDQARAITNTWYLTEGSYHPSLAADLQGACAGGAFNKQGCFIRQQSLVGEGSLGKSWLQRLVVDSYQAQQLGRVTPGVICRGGWKAYGVGCTTDEMTSVFNRVGGTGNGTDSKANDMQVEAINLLKSLLTYEDMGIITSFMQPNPQTGEMDNIRTVVRPGPGTVIGNTNTVPPPGALSRDRYRREEQNKLCHVKSGFAGLETNSPALRKLTKQCKDFAATFTRFLGILESAGMHRFTRGNGGTLMLAENAINLMRSGAGGGLPIITEAVRCSHMAEHLGVSAHNIGATVGCGDTGIPIFSLMNSAAVIFPSISLAKSIVSSIVSDMLNVGITEPLLAIKATVAVAEATKFAASARTNAKLPHVTGWRASTVAVFDGVAAAATVLYNTRRASEMASATVHFFDALLDKFTVNAAKAMRPSRFVAILTQAISSLESSEDIRTIILKHLSYEGYDTQEGMLIPETVYEGLQLDLAELRDLYETRINGSAVSDLQVATKYHQLQQTMPRIIEILRMYVQELQQTETRRADLLTQRMAQLCSLADGAVMFPSTNRIPALDTSLTMDPRAMEEQKDVWEQFEQSRDADNSANPNVDPYENAPGFKPASSTNVAPRPVHPCTLTYCREKNFHRTVLGQLPTFGRNGEEDDGNDALREDGGSSAQTGNFVSGGVQVSVDRSMPYTPPYNSNVYVPRASYTYVVDGRNLLTKYKEPHSERAFSIPRNCFPDPVEVRRLLQEVLHTMMYSLAQQMRILTAPATVNQWSCSMQVLHQFHKVCTTWIRAFLYSGVKAAEGLLEASIATLERAFRTIQLQEETRLASTEPVATTDVLRRAYRTLLQTHIESLVLLPAPAAGQVYSGREVVGALTSQCSTVLSLNTFVAYLMRAVTGFVSLEMHQHPLVALPRVGGAKNSDVEVFRVQTQMVEQIEGWWPAYPELSIPTAGIYVERRLLASSLSGFALYTVLAPGTNADPARYAAFLQRYLLNAVDSARASVCTVMGGAGSFPDLINPGTNELELDVPRLWTLMHDEDVSTVLFPSRVAPAADKDQTETGASVDAVTVADVDLRVGLQPLVGDLLEQITSAQRRNDGGIATSWALDSVRQGDAVAAADTSDHGTTLASESFEALRKRMIAMTDDHTREVVRLMRTNGNNQSARATTASMMGDAHDHRFWETQSRLLCEEPFSLLPNCTYTEHLLSTKAAGLFSVAVPNLFKDLLAATTASACAFSAETLHIFEQLPLWKVGMEEEVLSEANEISFKFDIYAAERKFCETLTQMIVDLAEIDMNMANPTHPFFRRDGAAWSPCSLGLACVRLFSAERPCAALLRAVHDRNLNLTLIVGKLLKTVRRLGSSGSDPLMMSAGVAELMILGMLAVNLPRGAVAPLIHTVALGSATPILRAVTMFTDIAHDDMGGYSTLMSALEPSVSEILRHPQDSADVLLLGAIFDRCAAVAGSATSFLDAQLPFMFTIADAVATCGSTAVDVIAALRSAKTDANTRKPVVKEPLRRVCPYTRSTTEPPGSVFVPLELLQMRSLYRASKAYDDAWPALVDTAAVRALGDRGMARVLRCPNGVDASFTSRSQYNNGYGPFGVATATVTRVALAKAIMEGKVPAPVSVPVAVAPSAFTKPTAPVWGLAARAGAARGANMYNVDQALRSRQKRKRGDVEDEGELRPKRSRPAAAEVPDEEDN